MSKLTLNIPTKNEGEEICVFHNDRVLGLKGYKKVDQQRLIVQECLASLLHADKVEIAYYESGAPYLPQFEDVFISVSHSKEWFAIQYAKVDIVGIDIQVIKEDIDVGKHYFVNDRELEAIEQTTLNINLIWAAKEAGYKFKKGSIDRYKEAMTVLAISGDRISMQINDEIILLCYCAAHDFVLVYVSEGT